MAKKSPSTRRAWIEILQQKYIKGVKQVALHPEGVDRNGIGRPLVSVQKDVALHPEGVDRNRFLQASKSRCRVALHPEGVDRNGLNFVVVEYCAMSPSTRRAWIEIISAFCEQR